MPSSDGATGGSIVAKRWRDLQGENSWSGLLDQLDMDLRKSIISYGELVQATGDGFNKEKRSPHAGDCMYDRSNLLAGTAVPAAAHYRVTKLLYATAEPSCLLHPAHENAQYRESNFMGYVAVATDEGAAALGRRDIVVAWRGSMTAPEWIIDFEFLPASAEDVLGSAAGNNALACVHRGFLSMYTASNPDSEVSKTSAKDQVLEEVTSLMELYEDEETSITVTGHSLGAALSILTAVDIVANGLNAPAGSSRPPCPVTAIVFACPPVGYHFFKSAFQSFRDLRALHVKNEIDGVPNLISNCGLVGVVYADVAVQLSINTALSPYLKDPKTTSHNLQVYLHGVAGEQGSAGGFKLEVDRDLALLNWDTDALKDEYPVPASWWVIQNKCMVKNAKGKWELKDYDL